MLCPRHTLNRPLPSCRRRADFNSKALHGSHQLQPHWVLQGLKPLSSSYAWASCPATSKCLSSQWQPHKKPARPAPRIAPAPGSCPALAKTSRPSVAASLSACKNRPALLPPSPMHNLLAADNINRSSPAASLECLQTVAPHEQHLHLGSCSLQLSIAGGCLQDGAHCRPLLRTLLCASCCQLWNQDSGQLSFCRPAAVGTAQG